MTKLRQHISLTPPERRERGIEGGDEEKGGGQERAIQKTLRHEGVGVSKEGYIALIVTLVLVSRFPLSHLGVLGDRVAKLGQGHRLVDDGHQGRGFWLSRKVLNYICSADVGQRQLL